MVKEIGRKMEINLIRILMKANILMIKRAVMEYTNGAQGMFIKETFLMIIDMDTERCTGTMEVIIKECGCRFSRSG